TKKKAKYQTLENKVKLLKNKKSQFEEKNCQRRHNLQILIDQL
ncbi:6540_t:CDS:1, partial [Dentiscutata heterogama]